MKKEIIYILLAFTFLFIAKPIAGQNLRTERLNINSAELKQIADSLYLNIEIDYSNIQIGNDRVLTLTPIITGTQNLELPPIVINGKQRQKAYDRAVNLSWNQAAQELYYAAVIKYQDNTMNNLRYIHVIPFEPWMRNASLDIREDLCGCGNLIDEVIVERIVPNVIMEDIPRPVLAYIPPEGEAIKARSREMDVLLDFPVNQTTILPDFMNNREELQKIRNMLHEVRSDANLDVRRIDITGYASPEGPVSLNERLSRGRANALRDYLAAEISFPGDIYHIEYGGENWGGLRYMVENSYLDYKNEILAAISDSYEVVRRKYELRRIDNGNVYRQLLREYFPKLRKAICNVFFNIRNFSVEEGKQILRTNPGYLSLNEMYHIANSYQEGTDAFIEVYGIAVTEYPDDPVANLNIAAAALSRNDPQRAILHLNKANKNSHEYANNMGVYYIQTGKAALAREELQKAAQQGSATARINLDILERMIQAGKIQD